VSVILLIPVQTTGKTKNLMELRLLPILLIEDFVEVFIHQGAVAQRTNYINRLHASADSMLKLLLSLRQHVLNTHVEYKENLDPEFSQCSEPLLDVVMFEAPAQLSSVPTLTLALAAPGL
jgi:hypothetical protein